MPARISKKTAQRRGRSQPLLMGTLLSCCVISVGAALWTVSASQRPVEQSRPIVVGQFDSIEIPVPVRAVPRGTRVGDIPLTMIRFPEHQIPEGAVRDINQYRDWVTTAELPGSLPLFVQNLNQSLTSKNPVITQIPDGMRAIAVKVDATSAVEGWATSGAHVDVILVRSDNETSTIIAENVRVLSAERSVDPLSGDQAPNVPSTVTLLVDQTQCLAINTAIPLGTIRFALRNSEDSEGWVLSSFDSSRLQKGSSNSPEKKISGYVTVTDPRSKKEKTFAVREGDLVEVDDDQKPAPSPLRKR